MITKKESMTLDFHSLRRFACNNETPAAVSLIEMNLQEPEMTSYVLREICPLTSDDADYIISLRDAGDEWDSVPTYNAVDFAYCDDPADAMRVAFSQLLHAACVRVVDAIDAGE